MPIYEFVCASCDTEFEKILSFSATIPPACPSCGGENVSRQVSRPAIHFKGSGWYITDSKSDSKASANGAAKQAKESSTGGETNKSEGSGESSKSEGSKGEVSKSESKSESKPAQSAQAAD
jgi:putative FmdB family regulatory protein